MIANIVDGVELLGINWPLPPKLELSFSTEPWFT